MIELFPWRMRKVTSKTTCKLVRECPWSRQVSSLCCWSFIGLSSHISSILNTFIIIIKVFSPGSYSLYSKEISQLKTWSQYNHSAYQYFYCQFCLIGLIFLIGWPFSNLSCVRKSNTLIKVQFDYVQLQNQLEINWMIQIGV